jgi:hypothetical protein
MSATQSRLGASAVKVRLTRSFAGAEPSATVVVGRARRLSPGDPCGAHEAGHALFADVDVVVLREGLGDPGSPVGAAGLLEDREDALGELTVGDLPDRGLASEPGVGPAAETDRTRQQVATGNSAWCALVDSQPATTPARAFPGRTTPRRF